mgnify:CR=1 FL=1
MPLQVRLLGLCCASIDSFLRAEHLGSPGLDILLGVQNTRHSELLHVPGLDLLQCLRILDPVLVGAEEALTADKERYVDIVQRGAEALSRYDREIAHTSDAMAVATALALKYNHISQGLGRVTWITQELEKFGPRLFQPR